MLIVPLFVPDTSSEYIPNESFPFIVIIPLALFSRTAFPRVPTQSFAFFTAIPPEVSLLTFIVPSFLNSVFSLNLLSFPYAPNAIP